MIWKGVNILNKLVIVMDFQLYVLKIKVLKRFENTIRKHRLKSRFSINILTASIERWRICIAYIIIILLIVLKEKNHYTRANGVSYTRIL